jgi:hypothetical protein
MAQARENSMRAKASKVAGAEKVLAEWVPKIQAARDELELTCAKTIAQVQTTTEQAAQLRGAPTVGKPPRQGKQRPQACLIQARRPSSRGAPRR